MEITNWLPETERSATQVRRFSPGQLLFCKGDRALGLYEIVSGKIRLVLVDSSGREAVLGFATAGETIAEASLFSSVHYCDATAMANTVVRLFDKAAVLAEFERNPKAAKAFMALLAGQVLNLRTRLECQSLHSARERVWHYLANTARREDGTVVLPGTVKDLAAELGLTHETLYRTLSGMEADGEIARRQREISIAGPSYDQDHM